MEKALQETMMHMSYGIYVLTTRFEKTINGMIASWASQVSYDPPLVMAAIHPNRYTHELLMRSGHFALHILAREQKALLSRFKGPHPEKKFASLTWHDGITGCPILTDCIGSLECRTLQTLAPGNHTLFIAKVVDAVFNTPGTPLGTMEVEGVYLGKD
jgi:flavin reductase (DIM6/NTAB) family NADH-FMN oxidoreductase RutF